MKSIYLLLLFAIFFVQCSTQKFTAEEKAFIEKHQMPEFSTPEITRFALEYSQYFMQLIDASKSGDENRIQTLSSLSVDWTKKASEFTQKMTSEDADKWYQYSQKIVTAASQ